jgi:hypothetical protein
MARTGPPKDIKPAALFRAFLRSPKPRWPVAFRFPEAPHLAMCVESMQSRDRLDALAMLAPKADTPEFVRTRQFACELVSRALLWEASGRPVLGSAADLDALPGHEVDSLVNATLDAIDVVSPTYEGSDVAAWNATLDKGALENWWDARALGGCVDISLGFGVRATIERPDRFFGVPLGALADSQWMVFRAARRLVEAEQEKKRGKP